MRVPVIATVTLAFVLNCPILLAAQGATSPTNREGFDVVSIRRNTNGRGGSAGLQPGGRFVAINATVHSLIQLAYGVDGFRIVNAPGWSESERYDVTAIADGGVSEGQLQRMMQVLLADRFGLVSHRETRMTSTYALIRARADGVLGPQMKFWTVDCAALRESGKMPPPPQTVADLMKVRPCVSSGGMGLFMGGGVKIDRLVAVLTSALDSPVTDHTALDGEFEIALRWNPDPLNPAADPNVPSLLTAVEEQLGLRLQRREEPVEVVVVDRIDRPTEN